MSADETTHPAGVLVQPGRPFGGQQVPDSVDALTVRIMVGELTAFNAPPREPRRWEGGSRGTVLLIPGFAGSKEDFLPMLDLLATDGWNVWAISQRGQADSVAPIGVANYEMADFVTDLLQVADIVGDGLPIHVVGHAFGGLVARAAALRLPSTFASLSFISSGPKCWTEEISELVVEVQELGGLGLWESRHADGSVDLLCPTPEQRLGREQASWTSNDCLVGMLSALLAEPDTTAQLLRTGVPTLVTHGSADDGWPLHWQELMARALDADYVVIDGAGHMPMIDDPAETARVLSSFFARILTAPGRPAQPPTPPSGSALDPSWQAFVDG